MFDVPGRKRRATSEHNPRNLRIPNIDSSTLALTLGCQCSSGLRRRPIEVQDPSFQVLDQQ